MFHTLMPAAAYRCLICRKPSAVRSSGVEATLTYSTPSCLMNSKSSSVGVADDCTQSLMPGAIFGTSAVAQEKSVGPPIAPANAILLKVLRAGLNDVLIVFLLDLKVFICSLRIMALGRWLKKEKQIFLPLESANL